MLSFTSCASACHCHRSSRAEHSTACSGAPRITHAYLLADVMTCLLRYSDSSTFKCHHSKGIEI